MTKVRITHIGGPTTLIEFAGWRILTDPTFDPAGKRYFFGWGTTSKKTTDPALSPDEIGEIDAVLVSHHHHGDNLDPSARDLLPKWGTTITTAKGARDLGGNSVGLRPWETWTLQVPGKPAVMITATPCRHGPAGMDAITGPVVGFSLTWEGQQNGALWVTGDTVLYPGLREVPQRIDVGTVVLHLGAVRFRYMSGQLRYTMDAKEAAELLPLIDPAHVIPVHYEGWTHFKQDRDKAEPQLAATPYAARVHWLDPGETTEFEV